MSRRILVDINVLVDVLMQRHPHYAASAAVWTAVEQHGLSGWVSADSFTTLYYLLRKTSDHIEACRGIQRVRKVFVIVPVDAALIEDALHSPLNDFEDAVQHECALRVKATSIVTRNIRHFRNTSVPAVTPEAFVATLDLT
ncbi:MAG: PIN domain-containing protein [Phycisphaerae bacterium]|nr:PIN domain-containing protein [Phycisphaerae bacterium]